MPHRPKGLIQFKKKQRKPFSTVMAFYCASYICPKSLAMANPLLKHHFSTPFETIPFPDITLEDFLPALNSAIEEARAEVHAITAQNAAPTFENTIEALEFSGFFVGRVSEIFFNLNSAETSDKMQALAQEISPLLTNYRNDIVLNTQLFARIDAVYQNSSQHNLSSEQQMLLDKTHKSFTRNGASLNEKDKKTLRELDNKIAKASLTFGEHVLAATNAFELLITEEKDLEGLPSWFRESAAEAAEEKGKSGWLITLQYPSYIPFMTYSANRELRETLYRAAQTKAFGGEFDNQELVLELVALRQARANLLGYESYGHFVLEERMAESPGNVTTFLEDLLEQALPAGKQDVGEVRKFAQELDGIDVLQRWDYAYYAEKLKKAHFNIDDEALKPYFELSRTVEGMFQVAHKLYGISFTKRTDIPVYHKDVSTYEVNDADGKHLAVFYTDFHPRAGKRNGAWMTSYRSQKIQANKETRPLVSIVCNFTKPTGKTPALLTFNEVTTLFHEFGHALHGMLAVGTYPSLTGTSVYWDFVELPSQFMENWCYEKEALDLFAVHYETEAKIPADLIKRIKAASTFQEGYQTVRQLSFGILDMAWHGKHQKLPTNVKAFEDNAMKSTELFEPIQGTSMSCQFSHIFQGGYAAGYYSYKWAEVLDADAFARFQEEGIFNQQAASDFRTHILAAGGTQHPMDLYVAFRGKKPTHEALLKRAGLLTTNTPKA